MGRVCTQVSQIPLLGEGGGPVRLSGCPQNSKYYPQLLPPLFFWAGGTWMFPGPPYPRRSRIFYPHLLNLYFFLPGPIPGKKQPDLAWSAGRKK